MSDAPSRDDECDDESDDRPPLFFYRVEDDYGCFSNFSPHPIVLDGKEWPTTEHYFQAQKYAGARKEEQIRCAPTPGMAARIGRGKDGRLRSDWESVKDAVMAKCVLAKFEQHAGIRETLLGTCDARLVEHTKNDSYWADGGDGRGLNMLGRILEGVRSTLRRRAVVAGIRSARQWTDFTLVLFHRGTCVLIPRGARRDYPAQHAQTMLAQALGTQDAPAGAVLVRRVDPHGSAIVSFGNTPHAIHYFLSVEARSCSDLLLASVGVTCFAADAIRPRVTDVVEVVDT